jgi:hypothetical protein
MKYAWTILLALAALAPIGCGSSDAPPAANIQGEGGSNAATGAGNSAAGKEAPDAVVTAFLESLRKGNDVLASSLLTDRARQETAKKGLKVQPPGTPDMTYQIGQTEYVTEAKDGAHVGSVWSEKLPSGETASFEVIWVLRLEKQGWRIAGMATPVGDEGEPLFLNFEDPEDLLRKWQASEPAVAEETPATELLPNKSAIENARDPSGNPLR